MNENKKYIRKSFWIHQYEKEELFLSEMRAQGWKFVKLHNGIPTKYEFDKCEPEEYSYQLDFVKTDEDTADYHQLFADAGWEEIMPWSGMGGKWYYFCKKKQNGTVEKIFTDQQSKLDLINKLIITYSGFFLLAAILNINSFERTLGLLSKKSFWLLIDLPLGIFAAAAIICLIYCEIAMLMLRNKIKKELNSRL